MQPIIVPAALAAIMISASILPAAADTRSPPPAGQWLSVSEIAKRAEAQGYVVREVESDDGWYEIDTRDKDGRHVELKMNPVSGEVVKVEYDD